MSAAVHPAPNVPDEANGVVRSYKDYYNVVSNELRCKVGGYVTALDCKTISPPDPERRPGSKQSQDQYLEVHRQAQHQLNETKERVREKLNKPPYNVHDLYHQTGCWQAVAKGPIFDKMTLCMIAINALWIAYDVDENSADTISSAKTQFQVAEHLFCIFFTTEWLVRFKAFRDKRDCLKDGWFVFDSLLVLTMVLETWVMLIIVAAIGGSGVDNPLGNSALLRVARLLRLSRMARMGRLLRAVPELLIQIKGIGAAMRSVLVTLVLLVILLYVFAIAFRQLLDKKSVGDRYFPTMWESMYSLLIYGTFLDSLSNISEDILATDVLSFFIFLLFVLCGALLVTNMLIGVLCEVVSNVAKEERERLLRNWIEEKLLEAKKVIDINEDGKISKGEFQAIFDQEKTTLFLNEVGVDVVGLVDFVDFIFDDTDSFEEKEKTLTFQEFLATVLQLRGTNQACVRDMVDMRKFVRAQSRELVNSVTSRLRALDEQVKDAIQNQKATLDQAGDKICGTSSQCGLEVLSLTSPKDDPSSVPVIDAASAAQAASRPAAAVDREALEENLRKRLASVASGLSDLAHELCSIIEEAQAGSRSPEASTGIAESGADQASEGTLPLPGSMAETQPDTGSSPAT